MQRRHAVVSQIRSSERSVVGLGNISLSKMLAGANIHIRCAMIARAWLGEMFRVFITVENNTHESAPIVDGYLLRTVCGNNGGTSGDAHDAMHEHAASRRERIVNELASEW